ncbi:hypothetical protein [Nocardia tengchongensis]
MIAQVVSISPPAATAVQHASVNSCAWLATTDHHSSFDQSGSNHDCLRLADLGRTQHDQPSVRIVSQPRIHFRFPAVSA